MSVRVTLASADDENWRLPWCCNIFLHEASFHDKLAPAKIPQDEIGSKRDQCLNPRNVGSLNQEIKSQRTPRFTQWPSV